MTELGLQSEKKIWLPGYIPHVLEEGELGAALDWQLKETRSNKLIFQSKPKRSESYTKQFLQFLFLGMSGIYRYSSGKGTVGAFPLRPLYPVKQIDGVLRDHYYLSNYSFECDAGAGVSTFGIIVGTDNSAPTIDDYKLGVQIAHGAGAGQLQYGSTSFAQPASDSTTSQLTVTRNFANASGGDITVFEVGMAAYGVASSYPVLIIRDIILAGITVPNGQTLTLNYRPQVVI